MPRPYDHQALWAKAKTFLNRAMDSDSGRSFDEQALWASAALELLGKSALARVSPALIADITDDGTDLLVATGLVAGSGKFTSVRASTLFKRCSRAFRPFDGEDAQKFANARNEYLHGGAVGFMTIPEQVWWPRFWALASILVDAQDRQLDELVGGDRVGEVEAYLAQNRKNIEHRCESLINRAKQRMAQRALGTLPGSVEREWGQDRDLTIMLIHRSSQSCPACGQTGTLEGEDEEDIQYEVDDYDDEGMPAHVSAIATIPSAYFSCPNCRLVLDNYQLIVEAGLPETFTVVDHDPGREPEYGNE